MTSEEFAVDFVNNAVKMKQYNQAISMLREVGLEHVLRRLGEPMELASESANIVNISAFEQAEARGWYAAIHHFFNLGDALIEAKSILPIASDFGAKAQLTKMGYSQEEIEEAE